VAVRLAEIAFHIFDRNAIASARIRAA